MSEIEKFKEDVKTHRELFDKSSTHYSDTERKNKIWEDLSKKYGMDAKLKWTTLRDKYVRQKRKLNYQSGSAAVRSRQWDLFPLLTFLDDTIQHRRMRENCNNNNSDERVCNFSMDLDESIEMVEELHTSPLLEKENPVEEGESSSSNQPMRPPCHKRKKSDVKDMFEGAINAFKAKMEKENTSFSIDEEDNYFLKGIGIKMGKMSPAAKTEFKIKILREAEKF